MVIYAESEPEAFHAVRVGLVKCTRPIAAIVANDARVIVPTATCSGQEDTITITRCEQATVHTIPCSPSMAAFSQQLDPLVIGRSAPTFTPVGGGGIVARLKGFQVISEAVKAEIRLAAILCEQIVVAIAVFISAPIVGVFRRGLAPSKIIAILIGAFSAHIASRPHRATRQAEVDVIVAIVSAICAIVFFYILRRKLLLLLVL